MSNKKIKTVLCAGVLVFASMLTACETEEIQMNTIDDIFDNTKVEITESINNHIYVITDPKTGVQYIVYREKISNAGLSGITPRLNSDGTLMIVETPDEASTNLS